MSDANFVRASQLQVSEYRHAVSVGNQMVPGRIGDPLAPYDSTFNGPGWRYVDDPNYIVYSSLDYNTHGIDTSGSNFPDWPLRLVNGEAIYVADPLARSANAPAVVSDEDFFWITKDTDTRADPDYDGPGGPSVPIGVDLQTTVLSWGSGPEKDIVVFRYEISNKSGAALESCFVAFSPGLQIRSWPPTQSLIFPVRVRRYTQGMQRNLAVCGAPSLSQLDHRVDRHTVSADNRL